MCSRRPKESVRFLWTAVRSCLVWVLVIKLSFYRRAASTFNSWDISQAPKKLTSDVFTQWHVTYIFSDSFSNNPKLICSVRLASQWVLGIPLVMPPVLGVACAHICSWHYMCALGICTLSSCCWWQEVSYPSVSLDLLCFSWHPSPKLLRKHHMSLLHVV